MRISLKVYVLIFLLLTAGMILATRHFAPVTTTAIADKAILDEAMHDIHLVRYNEQGQLIQRLQMNSWQRYKGETITYMIAPKLYVFSEKGNWEVSANKGKGYQDSLKSNLKELYLSSNVVVKRLDSQGPWELRTDSLWFDPITTLAKTDDPIVLDGPSTQITAIGIRSILNQQTLEFVKNVETRYHAS